MNIVIPLAGRGSRFAAVGIKEPKPLIDVLGKPMYAWAADSLPLRIASKLIFVCQREHSREGLRSDIEARYASYEPTVVEIDGVTEGQACTVLEARSAFEEDESLLIFNGDTAQRSNLGTRLESPDRDRDAAGLLTVFRADGDRWSFARLDSSGRVLETSEKQRISGWACSGLYYFRKATEYIGYCEQMVRKELRVNGEFYVAPMYNLMIADGLKILADKAEGVWPLGTPDDLTAFLAHGDPSEVGRSD